MAPFHGPWGISLKKLFNKPEKMRKITLVN
jgi:hypothetical protein